MFEPGDANEFVIVSIDRGRHVVRYKRTSLVIASPEQLRDVVQRLLAILRALVPVERRPEYGLIEDMRDAPFIAGPEMDRVLGELVPQLHEGWARIAVIVRTAIGRLQARRKSGESPLGSVVQICEDELQALLFVSPPGGRSRDG